ncbi:protein kinase domain-containing protein [Archangium sp.]|uniref:protein kinase domain-containing protein n=1 Tax=Archangium sp. TaxID=1872627 RepID=UPI00286D2C4A|nr:protein kinase [Archangium sp.]
MQDEKPAQELALPAPGNTLAGRYTVLQRLGQGGMGVVFGAYDVRLDRRVALKLLTAQRSGSASAQTRLLREAQAMARLSHPHVVAVYDAGVLEDGRVFISMEMVEGQTLRQWCREKTRPWHEVLEVYLAAGRGLAAAHAAGLVHRDFKPDNVLVGTDGRVRVTDFGVSQLGSPSEPSPPAIALADRGSATTLTQPGSLPGTLRYMAPEVLTGGMADARSDLFSFCVSLYEALFGQAPFAGEDVESRAQAMAQGRLTAPPARSDVPPRVTRAVFQGLEIDPRQRPASMEALLRGLSSHHRSQAPVRWLALGALAAVLVLATTALHQYRAERAQLCQGGPQRLAGVWDEAVRERLRQAFAATGEPYAQHVLSSTQQVLDAYARHWADQHREACEATSLRGEQPEPVLVRRMACLERRLQELKALGNVLVQADAKMVQKAVQAAQGLPRLRDCADVEALMAEVPPPEGAETRQTVEALRGELARVQALTLAGQYKQASEAAQATLERARAVDYPPLHAEALLLLGRADGYLDSQRSLPSYTEAALTALAHRQDALATKASILLAQQLNKLGRYEQAEWWLAQSHALLSRLHERGELEVLFEAVQGAGHYLRGEYAQAFSVFERGLQLSERTLGPEHPSSLVLEGNLAGAVSQLGRDKEYLVRMQRLEKAFERTLGPNHPNVLIARMNMVNTQVHLGHIAEARRTLEWLDSAMPKVFPPGTRNHLAWHMGHIQVAVAQGRLKYALSHANQELELVRSLGLLGSDDADSSLLKYNEVLVQSGRCREALASLTQLTEEFERRLSPQKANVSTARLHLAYCHEMLGRTAEALAHYERALELARQAYEGQGSWLAQARLWKARFLVKLGRASEGLELARQSHGVLLEDLGERAEAVGDSFWIQGEALLALGQAAEAVPLLEQALRVREQGGMDPRGTARVRFLLARALTTLGQTPERVRELVTLAREELARSEFPQQRERDELERWARAHLAP